jgi:hypothetical protein
MGSRRALSFLRSSWHHLDEFNVRLFDEIQDKSRQLEEASQHKSQFLANMSLECACSRRHHLLLDSDWQRGITKAALIEAAGSDLNEYMLAKLNRVVGREVENNLRGH